MVGGGGPTCPIRVHLGIDITGHCHGTYVNHEKCVYTRAYENHKES
jgi:hypothetical protein